MSNRLEGGVVKVVGKYISNALNQHPVANHKKLTLLRFYSNTFTNIIGSRARDTRLEVAPTEYTLQVHIIQFLLQPSWVPLQKVLLEDEIVWLMFPRVCTSSKTVYFYMCMSEELRSLECKYLYTFNFCAARNKFFFLRLLNLFSDIAFRISSSPEQILMYRD